MLQQLFSASKNGYLTIDILSKDKSRKMIPYININCKTD